MKRIVFFVFSVVLLFVGFACSAGKPVQQKVTEAEYLLLKDSVSKLNVQLGKLTFLTTSYEAYLIKCENERAFMSDSIRQFTDSIGKLNARPLMTKAQFLELYKYERLLKYYKICKRNTTQWKYYKGWSTRVFED